MLICFAANYKPLLDIIIHLISCLLLFYFFCCTACLSLTKVPLLWSFFLSMLTCPLLLLLQLLVPRCWHAITINRVINIWMWSLMSIFSCGEESHPVPDETFGRGLCIIFITLSPSASVLKDISAYTLNSFFHFSGMKGNQEHGLMYNLSPWIQNLNGQSLPRIHCFIVLAPCDADLVRACPTQRKTARTVFFSRTSTKHRASADLSNSEFPAFLTQGRQIDWSVEGGNLCILHFPSSTQQRTFFSPSKKDSREYLNSKKMCNLSYNLILTNTSACSRIIESLQYIEYNNKHLKMQWWAKTHADFALMEPKV